MAAPAHGLKGCSKIERKMIEKIKASWEHVVNLIAGAVANSKLVARIKSVVV
jgi:hypothetical protein